MRYVMGRFESQVRVARRDRMRGASAARLVLLSVCAMAASVPKIKLYTHTACPFAQRVWVALEATGLPFDRVDVNLCALATPPPARPRPL